jgi:phospholipase/carboxylesterase
VLLSHGRQDPVVPYAASQQLQELLQGVGVDPQLLSFEGGHTIDASVLPAIGAFVQQRLQP